ncbi:MAG: ABC transporter substrate-binding protein [Acidimicrobiia bacterium]
MKSRWQWLIALFAVMAMVLAACGDGGGADTTEAGADTTEAGADTTEAGADTTAAEGEGEGGAADADFTLFGAPTGTEGEAMEGFIGVYNAEVGSNIGYRGSDGFEQELRIAVEGGDPPSVAFTPQPASICEFADQGALVSLEDMGFDIAAMEENHSQYWMNLGLCEDGNHYGIPWFPNFKSVVFYHIPTFDEGGYAIPETYEDLVALSQQMVADGQTPWCFGFESGDATGWPGTDWIEDIFVRLHGSDAYRQWYEHEIPFNDPMVVEAFDTFGQILLGEGFVLGGAENVSGIAFGDSPGPLFAEPAGCAMLKQGSFIANFFVDQAEYEDGEESEIGVFAFPTIGGNTGAMGGGDTLMVFEDDPAIAAVIQDWITPEWQCTLASASGGGVAPHGGHGVEGVERLPGHKDVDPNCYETDSAKVFAEAITTALADNAFVFDASDLMPPEVGQQSFWIGMVEFTQGVPVDEIVNDVEASWPS